MESNRLTIIVINARSCYDRSSEISADIFDCNIRSAVFRFVLLIKHAKNNISNGMKETIEERTVIEKERAKFFRNSKHTVTMDTANELTGHMKRALQIIFVTASRAESRFTSKRNKLQFPTVWASQKSATKRRVTTMNHFVDIFNDGSPWMNPN